MADASSGERERRRALPLGGALLLAALVSGLVVALARDGGVHRGGPLACSDCPFQGGSLPIDVDATATSGMDVIFNRGDDDAVLENVTFDHLSPGIEILGPLVLRVGDYTGIGLAAGLIRGLPRAAARGDAHRVRGFVVHPYRRRADAVEILVGLRPHRAGTFSYRSLLLHYRVGGKRYVARYPTSVTICAPYKATAESCHPQMG